MAAHYKSKARMRKSRIYRREIERDIDRVVHRTNVEFMFERLANRIEHLGGRIEQLGQRMDERFKQVDKRFEQVDKRFEKVDERFEKVDERFGEFDSRLKNVEMDVHQLKAIISRTPSYKIYIANNFAMIGVIMGVLKFWFEG